MRRMLDPKELEGLGGGGGESGEIHLYDVQYFDNTNGELYFSFTTNKLLPGFTKPGDTLHNKSMKDYPEFFPKANIAIPCSGAISNENKKYPCIAVSIIVSEYDTKGYVMPKIIYNNDITTTMIIPTNKQLKITMRY